MRRPLTTLVLLLIATVAPCVRADGPPVAPPAAPPVAPIDPGPPEDREYRKRAEGIATEILKNHPHSAVDLFTDAAILDIAGAPRAATTILRAAAVCAQRIDASSEAIATKMLDRLSELTESLSLRTDDGPLYARAIGFGQLAMMVIAGLRGKIGTADQWREFLAAARKPGPGDPLTAQDSVLVLSSLVVAGARHGLDVYAWEFLAGELDAFARGKTGDPEAKRLAVWVDLERGIQLARSDAEASKAHLLRALPLVASGSILDEKVERMIGRYNIGLTAALEAGVPVTVLYRAPVFTSRWGWLQAFVPVGTGWKAENATEGDQQMSTLVRVREGRDKVTIRLAAYSWAKLSDGTAKKGPVTDNAEALITAAYPSRVAGLASRAKITKESKSLSGRFSKWFGVSQGYEVRGETADGTNVRLRDWYLKSSNPAKWTFVLELEQEGRFLETDPEVQLILDSLHEVGGGK